MLTDLQIAGEEKIQHFQPAWLICLDRIRTRDQSVSNEKGYPKPMSRGLIPSHQRMLNSNFFSLIYLSGYLQGL